MCIQRCIVKEILVGCVAYLDMNTERWISVFFYNETLLALFPWPHPSPLPHVEICVIGRGVCMAAKKGERGVMNYEL
jgi:hypothetical protein